MKFNVRTFGMPRPAKPKQSKKKVKPKKDTRPKPGWDVSRKMHSVPALRLGSAFRSMSLVFQRRTASNQSCVPSPSAGYHQ